MTRLVVFVVAACVTVAVVAAPGWSRDGHPTSRAARAWHPEPWWLHGAFCVHNHESVDWFLAGRDWAGNPSPYYGGMQFLPSTWRAAGGHGLPSDWSPREQLYRAFVTWRADGGSWREWGTAGMCGLR